MMSEIPDGAREKMAVWLNDYRRVTNGGSVGEIRPQYNRLIGDIHDE